MVRTLVLLALAVIAVLLLAMGGVYLLSEAKLRDFTPGPRFTQAIPTDAASIERGRHVARTRGCMGCHGQQLEGKDFDEQWDWPERAVAPNLARYVREHDVATIEAAIRQGIGADGRALTSMPSFNFTRLGDEDLVALIAFLKSAPIVEIDLPTPKLGWAVRWSFAIGEEKHMAEWADAVPPLRVDSRAEPQRARGEYLALTMCNECHELDVRGLSVFPPPTPDLAMVAGIPRANFETLIKTGTGLNGRKLGLMELVAPDRFPELTDSEIDDLHAYLSSLVNEPAPENVFWRPRRN
ncbi:cytochrome c [Dokdonella sp.]|uniref:cytochrome c n=1 Tax=Dokdonella sp. TaxID=2291710 RepID=UPI0035297002